VKGRGTDNCFGFLKAFKCHIASSNIRSINTMHKKLLEASQGAVSCHKLTNIRLSLDSQARFDAQYII